MKNLTVSNLLKLASTGSPRAIEAFIQAERYADSMDALRTLELPTDAEYAAIGQGLLALAGDEVAHDE